MAHPYFYKFCENFVTWQSATVIMTPLTNLCCIKRYKPIQEDRLLERSIMARLLGLLSSDRFAREISAVTRVIVILKYTTLEFTNHIYAFLSYQDVMIFSVQKTLLRLVCFFSDFPVTK